MTNLKLSHGLSNMKYFIQLLLILSFGFYAQARDSFFGHAKDRGVLVTLTTDKYAYKTGDKIKIQGSIKATNFGDDYFNFRHNNGLLEEFRKEGFDIVASYPNEAFDISSSIVLQSAGRDEIKFSYETQALTDGLNAQFSLKIFNNHQDTMKLARLAAIKAKLEKRILLLTNLCNEHRKKKSSQDVINYLQAEIAKLDQISQKILARLSSEENLVAENTTAFLVNNETVGTSRVSTVMNRYRFVVAQTPGIAIEGQNIKFDTKIINLRQSDNDYKNDFDDDRGSLKGADFIINGQYINTSIPKKMPPGSTITYSYQTAVLPVSPTQYCQLALFEIENGRRKSRLGALLKSVSVLDDNVAPKWLAGSVPGLIITYVKNMPLLNLNLVDDFGRLNSSTITAKLIGSSVQDVTTKLTKVSINDGQVYNISGDLNPLAEGDYTFEITAKDLGGNVAQPNPYHAEFKVDRTAPVVDLQLQSAYLTKQSTANIAAYINDASPVSSDVYVNGAKVFSSTLSQFSATVNLNLEGSNLITIKSYDAAGNVAADVTRAVFRDTTPPVLTILSPTADTNVNGIQFNINGLASEAISAATVNGASLNVGSDKISINGVFTSLNEGRLILTFGATDLAGNTSVQSFGVNVILKALNAELLSLYFDNAKNKLLVKGAAGAVRPGLTVQASCSLFNRDSTTAEGNGSFVIELNTCSDVNVSVYDPILNRTEQATLHFGSSNGVVLSGTIKNVDEMPLTNAQVTMIGTGVTVNTDASGVFTFKQESFGNKLIYGDQKLLIDGRGVTQATGATQRKYSIVQVGISISLNEKNVLPRPIYMAPILLDGNQTLVNQSSGGVVSSPNAPGVILDIPPDSVNFPDGSTESAVTIQEIPADKATVPVFAAAKPNTVIALEPSGTTFSKPVDLVLPNKNNFAHGAELVILLMNSRTGLWEVGGAAVVSDDGSSIVTKDGQGIRHFSLAYAAPVGAIYRQVGAKDKPGADTFDGAVTAKIVTPAFKSLGNTVAAGLTYKSAWAKPTAMITNLFDLTSRKVEVTLPEQYGGQVDKVKYTLKYCSLDTPLFGSKPTEDDVKCEDRQEDFLANIQYKIRYQNTYSTLTPEKVVASFQTENIKTPNDESLTFTGLPAMAAISYALPLKDTDTNEFLETGIHPYTAHYDLHFKEMITGTRIIEQKINSGEPQIQQAAFTEKDIARLFPQDLIESLYVQNYQKSEAGTGWRVDGAQKIVNTFGEKIMIEGESGEISTYSIANTIDTLANLGYDGNLDIGVGLNKWPYVMYTDGESRQFVKLNMLHPETREVSNPLLLAGTIAGNDYYNYTKTIASPYVECTKRNIFNQCEREETRYIYTYVPTSYCSKTTYSYTVFSKASNFLIGQDGVTYGVDAAQDIVFKIQNGQGQQVAGTLVEAPRFNNYYSSQTDTNEQKILNYCNSMYGMSCAFSGRQQYEVPANGASACGALPATSGYVPLNWDLNSPMALVAAPQGNVLIVADTGHHAIRSFDLDTGATQFVAGTGRVGDSTTPGNALGHDIYYPRGLVYDNQGNLYISNKGGYIRKLDQFGNIEIFAGDAVNGKLTDSGDAREMKFSEPFGLVIDQARNYLYVADTGQNRVVRINLTTREAQTVAGNRVQGFSGDGGSALDASLNAPTHLGLDPDGNLLIADSGNGRIRRVIFQPTAIGTLAYAPTTEDHSRLYRNANGTWTRQYRSGALAYFDQNGRQYQAVDPSGHVTQMAYNSDGFLTKIQDPVGQSVEYSYSAKKLRSVTDLAGRVTSFSYNSANQLVRVDLPDGSSKKYQYDNDGLLTSETNERNIEVQYVYNAQSRLEKVIKPDQSPVKIADSVEKTSGGGVLTPLEQATNSVTDSNNNSTVLAKDFMGYISTVTDALGRKTLIKRDLKGRPIELTDVDGSVTRNTFDATYGDLVSTTNVSLGITTSTQYNSFGQVTAQIDAYGKVVNKTYNAQKQLIRETAPDGKYLTYVYNSLGLITNKSSYNAAGVLKNQMLYDYNSLGQLIKQTDQNGKYTSYTYDLAGNVLTSTSYLDANTASTTQFQYDEMNRLVKVTSPKGEVTQYSYLPTGELSEIKDPKQKITSFDYNINGQLIQKTDPQGRVSLMTYDLNGNLLTEKDPANQLKQYTYNAINKVTKVQTADDVIQYQYNLKDEVVQISNNAATVTYQRDAKQRITQESVAGLNYPAHATAYTYSDNDLRLTLASPYQNVGYTYNQDNYSLIGLQSSATGIYGFDYDEANRLVSISRPGSVTNYTYDVASNLTRIAHKSGGVERSYFEYNYDLRNFITQKRAPASTLSYGYDLNGQLTSATKAEDATQNESFSYDALGNRLTYNGQSSTYDNSGQQIQDDGLYTYVYDNNGNIIYKSNKSNGTSYAFEYSALNQLKKATVTSTPLGGTVLKTIYYKYDPLGRRIGRHVVDSTDSSQTNLRKYYYDGPNVLAELDGGDNLTATYTYSPLRDDDILGAKFTTAATQSGAVSSGQVLASSTGVVYYLKDHLNTVTDIITGSGAILQKMDYTAYGVLKSVKDVSGGELSFANAPVRTSYAYTGREYEPELGMYYYRARYYDPTTGRFLQKDKAPGMLGAPPTFLSKYLYSANNPINLSDPSGHSWVSDFWDHNNDWVRDVAVGLVTIGILVVCGAGVGSAALAVASVAGGALTVSLIVSSFQDGDYLKNVGDNFHSPFRFGAGFLAASAIISVPFGGLSGAGGNGFQGWISTKNPVFGQYGDLTVGNSAIFSGASPASSFAESGVQLGLHSWGHTLQYFGFAAAGGALGLNTDQIMATYLGFSGLGVNNGVLWKGPEYLADFLGSLGVVPVP